MKCLYTVFFALALLGCQTNVTRGQANSDQEIHLILPGIETASMLEFYSYLIGERVSVDAMQPPPHIVVNFDSRIPVSNEEACGITKELLSLHGVGLKEESDKIVAFAQMRSLETAIDASTKSLNERLPSNRKELNELDSAADLRLVAPLDMYAALDIVSYMLEIPILCQSGLHKLAFEDPLGNIKLSSLFKLIDTKLLENDFVMYTNKEGFLIVERYREELYTE